MVAVVAAAVVIAGLLAVASDRQAEADILGGDAGLVLSPDVVVSGGTFLATITAQEDDAGGDNLRFRGSNTEILSLTEVSCTTGAGACLVAAAPCAAPPAGEICLEWADEALDGNGATGTVTVVVEVEATCDAGREFINPVAEQPQGVSFDQDSVLCYPLDAPLLTIEKSFDGDDAGASFDFLIETDGSGCFVSINGGAPAFVPDNTTFSISPGDVAGVYCGTGTTTVTELPGSDGTFDGLECTDDSPLFDQFQINDASVTMSFLDEFFRVFCTFTNSEDGEGECPTCCPCGGVDIDIDNTNTNVIGIDNENENENTNNNTNENENTNENTSTQNQTNDQDQSNNNTQTNNIDSSPEVNISGVAGEKPAPKPQEGAAPIKPPSTGDAGLARSGGGQDGTWVALGGLALAGLAGLRLRRTSD
jgi:hypothetical protein